MKKTRIVGLLLSMMTFCASVLAGCGLITVNRHNYLNQVVTSIVEKETNHKINIYKKDLIEGYKNYGGYYSQNSNEEEAYKNVLDLLINRKIVAYECEKLIEDGTIPQDEKAIEKGNTYVYQQTLEALESRYDSYLNQLLGNTDSSSSSSNSDRVFSQYNPSARLVDENTIQRLNLEKGVLDDFTYTNPRNLDKKEDREILLTAFKGYVKKVESDTRNKALANYVDALRKEEEGLDLVNDTDSVLMREIEKLYQNEYESFRIEQYEEYLRKISGQSDEYLKNVTVSDVLNKYASKVNSAYTTYVIEGNTGYEDTMKSSASSVYYYMEDKDYPDGQKATEFFQVAHILFKFSDETDDDGKTAAEKYKELMAREDTDSESYTTDMNNLIASVKPVLREYKNGELTETTLEMNAWDKAVEIKNEIDACQDTNIFSDSSKLAKFRDYIYKYNDDPGQITNMTAGMNYTIGVNYSQPTEDADYTIYSGFVEEFNAAAIGLYNGGKGKIGAVSDPVLSENGIHLLIYLGPIKNIFEGINGSLSLNNVADENGNYPIYRLAQSYPNPFYQKSYFDIIYEEIVTDNFSSYEQDAIENLTGNYNITTNKSRYEDLF